MSWIAFQKITTGNTWLGRGRNSFLLSNVSSTNHAFALLAARFSSNVTKGSERRLFREELNVIYDSKCNVCKHEIDFLKRRDEKHNGAGYTRLKFTDIEDEAYDEKDPANGGISYEEAMTAMRAVTSKGQVLSGVQVFRQAYQEVGMGWMFVITKFTGVQMIADAVYNIFARYRTNLTRGKSVDELVSLYKEKKALKERQEKTICKSNNRCQKL